MPRFPLYGKVELSHHETLLLRWQDSFIGVVGRHLPERTKVVCLQRHYRLSVKAHNLVSGGGIYVLAKSLSL